MGKVRATNTYGLGGKKANDSVFSKNHMASEAKLSPEVKQKIASMGLNRVAGNIYECPSTQDFWRVQGNSVVKLVVDEVDNGEKIPAAPSDTPMDFLNEVLDDLTFYN